MSFTSLDLHPDLLRALDDLSFAVPTPIQARAEALGDAWTLVSPDEEAALRAIERALRLRLERVMLPGFDYATRPAERLEVPFAERITAMRAPRVRGRAASRYSGDRRGVVGPM
jgi:superfamily II DNA/RNA helicase